VQNLLPRHGVKGEIRRVVKASTWVGATEKYANGSHRRFLTAACPQTPTLQHQRVVTFRYTKLKTEIARILKDEGYISTFQLVDENKTTQRCFRVFPEVHAGPRSVITGV